MKSDLLKVKQAFIGWRSAHRNGQLPDILKKQAVELVDDYGIDVIANQLSLKTTTLSRWLTSYAQETSTSKASSTEMQFIELNSKREYSDPSIINQTKATIMSCAIFFGSGIKLKLDEQPLTAVAELMSSLMKGGRNDLSNS